MTDRQWSEQQQAIFQWFLAEGGNLVVRARAGTGKTTTILEALRQWAGAGSTGKACLCAFNKRIAEELSARFDGAGDRAVAKTLHSIGFSYVLGAWKGVRVDDRRGFNLARRACGEAPKAVVLSVAKLASLAKNMLPFLHYSEAETVRTYKAHPELHRALRDIGYDFDVFPTDEELEEEGWTEEVITRAAALACHYATKRDGTVDFDDMIFVPLALELVRPRYELVVVDEAQDMNAAQLELARRVCRQGGRIAVVGDDRQAIYGFRGADSGSIDRLKSELAAVELPLTITYRCPKAVVEVARRLVPDYEAAPTAPEGAVNTLASEKLLGAVRPGDFVLSRKNAPLMPLCLSLLSSGVRAKIEGRDIGRTLAALVKKLDKGDGVADFLAQLSHWEGRQVEAALSADNEAKAQEAQDKAQLLRVLAGECDSVGDLLAKLEDLFTDMAHGQKVDRVVLSSVHKAKGLEADKVFVLTHTLYPGKGRRKMSVEESNIEYVAVTRAKRELVLVQGEVRNA